MNACSRVGKKQRILQAIQRAHRPTVKFEENQELYMQQRRVQQRQITKAADNNANPALNINAAAYAVGAIGPRSGGKYTRRQIAVWQKDKRKA